MYVKLHLLELFIHKFFIILAVPNISSFQVIFVTTTMPTSLLRIVWVVYALKVSLTFGGEVEID